MHHLILHLVTPCVVFFPNVEEVSILFILLGCLWLLIIFVVSYFSDFVLVFNFFQIFRSVNSSGLFLLFVETYARGFSLLCLLGFLNFCGGGFFLLIQILYLLVLLDIPSGLGLCVVLWGVFFLGFYRRLWCVFYVPGCKGWILYSFWGGSFWNGGIVGCLLVCDRYPDDLTVYVFYEDV